MRAVLDASVLIAGFLSETGASRALLRHAQERTFTLVLSDALLAEVERNLRRLGVTIHTTDRYLRLLRRMATVVNPSTIPRVLHEHPPDDAVLAYAVTGEADVLVTLDRRHLLPRKQHRGIPIAPPAELLRTPPRLPDEA